MRRNVKEKEKKNGEELVIEKTRVKINNKKNERMIGRNERKERSDALEDPKKTL